MVIDLVGNKGLTAASLPGVPVHGEDIPGVYQGGDTPIVRAALSANLDPVLRRILRKRWSRYAFFRILSIQN